MSQLSCSASGSSANFGGYFSINRLRDRGSNRDLLGDEVDVLLKAKENNWDVFVRIDENATQGRIVRYFFAE